MKSARISAYGGFDLVALDEIAVPTVGPHEVLIRVEAASLNPLDLYIVRGDADKYFPVSFPHEIGTDLAGTVVKAGSLAARWRTGDRVIARPDPVIGGAFSEFTVVSASAIATAPRGLSIEAASALPTAAGTAWQALFEVANLRENQTVLIHGGSGGVGRFAIQMARLAGARVIATASSENIESVRALGAQEVIDYHLDNFSNRLKDVDLVLDTVGGDTQKRSFSVLRPGGVLVSLVSTPDEALATEYGVTASFVFHRTDATRLELISGLAEQGSLKVHVARVFDFFDLQDALGFLATGHPKGKVVISINGSASARKSS